MKCKLTIILYACQPFVYCQSELTCNVSFHSPNMRTIDSVAWLSNTCTCKRNYYLEFCHWTVLRRAFYLVRELSKVACCLHSVSSCTWGIIDLTRVTQCPLRAGTFLQKHILSRILPVFLKVYWKIDFVDLHLFQISWYRKSCLSLCVYPSIRNSYTPYTVYISSNGISRNLSSDFWASNNLTTMRPSHTRANIGRNHTGEYREE